MFFHPPLDGYHPWGGGLNALSGAQIREIDEKYGKYVEGTIPAEDYLFLTVMEKEALQFFSTLSFHSKDEIQRTLDTLSLFSTSYEGVFDARELSQRFPYLQDFFAALDTWRAETGRVTFDSNVLTENLKKSLSCESGKELH